MARLPLKPSVVKRLFALSGNRCAYENCNNPMVDEFGTIIGEICHIEAAEPGGERFNPSSNDEYRRSFENLILLCATHHKKTNYVSEYSVEKLRELKLLHENKNINNEFNLSDNLINKAIDNYMKYNENIIQISNQTKNQNINNQIGVQHNYFDTSKINSSRIEGARYINPDFEKIISEIKQLASPPDKTVIDFRNELKDRIVRDVVLISTKYLRFRKNNGRIIAEVESYEKEHGMVLREEDESTQELLREFLKNNDKEKNEELKRLLDHKGQQEAAIITCDGFLINGNRRKMVLEELYKQKNQDSRFEMMRVVVLPRDVTELEIQKIENRYQLQSEGKSEYQGLNRAIKYKRNIENGFPLDAQLRDDPNYYDLPPKEFEKKVKEFEKNYLKPLEHVDNYLDTFNRKGMYNTISESVSDREGRWQAFIDYSQFYSNVLSNKHKMNELNIRENEIGKIQNAVFKIIRKRTLNTKTSELGKVHEFIRKLSKYLSNESSKKMILKIADVPEELPEELTCNAKGEKLSERDIDEVWGSKYREQILGNLNQAHKFISSQEEREKPLDLLEDALKKLRHNNMKIEAIEIAFYEKAMETVTTIISEAERIYNEIDNARYKAKKLIKKNNS